MRSMRHLACAALIALAGCNGGEDDSKPSRVPLTFDQVSRRDKDTPRNAVLRLWFWAQWGSAPNVVGMYDSRVRTLLSQKNISGVYALLRGTLVELRPRSVSVVLRKRNLAFLTVEARGRSGGPVRHSFLLRRSGETWLILHDTLLETSLVDYADAEFVGPGASGRAKERARARGEELAARYRSLFATNLFRKSGDRLAPLEAPASQPGSPSESVAE